MNEELHCVLCDEIIKYSYTIIRYSYTLSTAECYKCSGCKICYMKLRHGKQWQYLENRAWKKRYGKWIDCTKEIKRQIKEVVVFT